MSESLSRLTVMELRARTSELQRQLNALQYEQLTVLAELDRRGCAALGLRGLPDLVMAELTVGRRAARTIATRVNRLAPRRALDGQPLEPQYPCLARAWAAGELGSEHADVITEVIERLPEPVRAEHREHVERTLVELASSHDPRTVKLLGERIVAHLDPDGARPEEDEWLRSRRGVRLVRHGDGSGELTGTLSPGCQAVWEAVLGPLAAARPADALGEDVRTNGQRWHDAFERAGQLLLAAKEIPDRAGLPAQLIITMTLTELEARAGRATTHHGGTLSIGEALRVAADAQLIPVVLADAGGVLSYGRGRRLASSGQRKALFARDRGCTFPGCAKPAALAEIHHATDWTRGGRTDLDNLAIACGYHNNEAPKQGWQTVLIDGVPYWRPPRWHDPNQRPVRNWLHHPELLRPASHARE